AAVRPATRVIGVEPAGVPKLSAALAAGAPTRIARAESLADGLLPVAVGHLPFAHFRGLVGQAVQVTDDQLVQAVRFLHHEMGLRVEPSGAATVAALLAGQARPSGPTVAIVSGGNVDPELFQRLVN
ncbi:MAG: pyridoxal-phosphate dependent enzyme, partial [Gemmatimonadales bacterium]